MKNIITIGSIAVLGLAAMIILLKPSSPKTTGNLISANAQQQTPPAADEDPPSDFIHVLPNIIKTFTQIDLPTANGTGVGGSGGTIGGGGAGGGGPVAIDDPAFVARAGAALPNGYYQMPEPVGGEYVLRDPPACRYGNIELLKLINQASIMWKNKYADSRIEIWNINASGGHASHKNGIDVDIAITNESAANMCSAFYDQPASDPSCAGISEGQCRSVELGKMFLASNIVQMIFYDDPAVNDAITAYARSTNKSNFILIEPWGTQACGAGHHNHFHVRIMDQYKLADFGPDGC